MRAHVEVDRLDIVQGPGFRHMASVFALLADTFSRHRERGIDSRFTAQTAASNRLMKVHLKICQVSVIPGKPTTYDFSAIFQGKAVEGTYDIETGKGYFQEL